MSGSRCYYSLFFAACLTVAVIFATSNPAQAHEVDTCLARLSQTAQLLRACEVAQNREGQCNNLHARLDRNRQTCRAESFTEESIEHAIAYGGGSVEGALDRSPYRQAVQQRQQEESQMQPNLQRFKQYFPQYGNFRDDVAERFNSRLCPNAYEGGRDRWLYTGTVTLLRYDLSEVKSAQPTNRETHLFAQGKQGECYPVKAQLAPDMPFLVVNLPDQMLSQLEQKGGVVRCESATCASDRAALEELYQHYQTTYRQYRQLQNCVDLMQRGQLKSASKGGAPTVSLPAGCPTKEVNVALLNAKGLTQELDQRLFGQVTHPLRTSQNVTKSE
ncbi:MAG TPA: hypothetical protein VM553_10565 [Dongiaceae bacterium]|nr:hypothetical protein [Dongiaceae bacterium]